MCTILSYFYEFLDPQNMGIRWIFIILSHILTGIFRILSFSHNYGGHLGFRPLKPTVHYFFIILWIPWPKKHGKYVQFYYFESHIHWYIWSFIGFGGHFVKWPQKIPPAILRGTLSLDFEFNALKTRKNHQTKFRSPRSRILGIWPN